MSHKKYFTPEEKTEANRQHVRLHYQRHKTKNPYYKPIPKQPPETKIRVVEMWLSGGYNQSEIAKHFGLSKQRVSQIIRKYKDGRRT